MHASSSHITPHPSSSSSLIICSSTHQPISLAILALSLPLSCTSRVVMSWLSYSFSHCHPGFLSRSLEGKSLFTQLFLTCFVVLFFRSLLPSSCFLSFLAPMFALNLLDCVSPLHTRLSMHTRESKGLRDTRTSCSATAVAPLPSPSLTSSPSPSLSFAMSPLERTCTCVVGEEQTLLTGTPVPSDVRRFPRRRGTHLCSPQCCPSRLHRPASRSEGSRLGLGSRN